MRSVPSILRISQPSNSAKQSKNGEFWVFDTPIHALFFGFENCNRCVLIYENSRNLTQNGIFNVKSINTKYINPFRYVFRSYMFVWICAICPFLTINFRRFSTVLFPLFVMNCQFVRICILCFWQPVTWNDKMGQFYINIGIYLYCPFSVVFAAGFGL